MQTCLNNSDDNAPYTRAGCVWYALDLLVEAQDWPADEAEIFEDRAADLLDEAAQLSAYAMLREAGGL